MIAETPKIHEKVDYWLNQWARWMRVRPADEMELGFPERAKPFIGGGESRRGEEFEEDQNIEIWKYNCQTMNALIGNLPPAQQCAVGHIYAGDCWRFPRDNLFELLELAAETLLIGMHKWGVGGA